MIHSDVTLEVKHSEKKKKKRKKEQKREETETIQTDSQSVNDLVHFGRIK